MFVKWTSFVSVLSHRGALLQGLLGQIVSVSAAMDCTYCERTHSQHLFSSVLLDVCQRLTSSHLWNVLFKMQNHKEAFVKSLIKNIFFLFLFSWQFFSFTDDFPTLTKLHLFMNVLWHQISLQIMVRLQYSKQYFEKLLRNQWEIKQGQRDEWQILQWLWFKDYRVNNEELVENWLRLTILFFETLLCYLCSFSTFHCHVIL